VLQEPITPDELWRLTHDAAGRQLAPLTRIASAVVLGYDPVRLGEYLEQFPDARTTGATVHGRPGDASTQGVLDWLAERGVPATLVDVDAQPMTRDELWDLLAIPNSNVRTPYTEIDGVVVLGNDRRRLAEVLASRA
jgi:hypothetical protein